MLILEPQWNGLLTFLDFGGTTKIHSAILRYNYPLVEQMLIKDISKVNTEANFLGHHALHLAILNPQMVALLLKHRHDIELDIVDANQTTPLMYAMSYGTTGAAKLLLKAGSDPFRRDKLNGFCAWDYALICGDAEFLIEVLECYRTCQPELFDETIAFCLWERMLIDSARTNDYECEMLSYLLRFEHRHDDVEDHDNTLLHLCREHEVKPLLHYKNYPINQKNTHGYTPLMVIARFGDPLHVRKLIDQGALINVVDERGRNALHHLNRSVQKDYYGITSPDTWTSTLETAAVLVNAGINMQQGDYCRCQCSSSGCLSLGNLLAQCHWHKPQLQNLCTVPWLLEWLILLFWSRPEELNALANALYRRQRFDELGMTHTCNCHKNTNAWSERADGWIRSSECMRGGCDRHHSRTGNCCEEACDREEIWDEERILSQKLHDDCDKFSAAVNTDHESSWVYVLARRAVMMEESLAKAASKYEDRARQQAVAYRKRLCELDVSTTPSNIMTKIGCTHILAESRSGGYYGNMLFWSAYDRIADKC